MIFVAFLTIFVAFPVSSISNILEDSWCWAGQRWESNLAAVWGQLSTGGGHAPLTETMAVQEFLSLLSALSPCACVFASSASLLYCSVDRHACACRRYMKCIMPRPFSVDLR